MPEDRALVPRSQPGFIDRTLGNLRAAWRDIAASAKGAIGAGAAVAPGLPDGDLAELRDRLQACLEARGGEVSARARAAELGRLYLGLNAEGRLRFMRLLVQAFDVDRGAVAAAAQWLATETDDERRRAAERALRKALDSPRARLLTQFNALPEGVKFLVDMRAELLALVKKEPDLAALEADIKDVLVAWFDIGFLELARITWDSPAALLEKLSKYEAVHAVRSWDDLKNRLDSDRRCFAYFHPRMPSEPLIFVEAALVAGLADNVQALLDEHAPVGDPRTADTAIFYSISNAQRGLAGISFGGFLIKRVAEQLAAEFPRLKTFATLSPIPGLRGWIEKRLGEGHPGLLTKSERKAIAALAAGGGGSKGKLKQLLADSSWIDSVDAAAALKGPLLRLAAAYLLEARRDDGGALDPVANFHLSNGARVERLDWLADRSPNGLKQSYGLMVNYLYDLDRIEANHEAYVGDRRITAAKAVTGLA